MTYQNSQENVLDTPVNEAFERSGKALAALLSPQAPGPRALLWDDAEDSRDTRTAGTRCTVAPTVGPPSCWRQPLNRDSQLFSRIPACGPGGLRAGGATPREPAPCRLVSVGGALRRSGQPPPGRPPLPAAGLAQPP